MVQLRPDYISRPLNDGTAAALASCFHVTTLNHLMSIINNGFVSGGDVNGRLMIYFIPFAPRGRIGCEILKPKAFPGQARIALYISAKDLQAFEARLDTDGRFVTCVDIPFSAFSAAWYESNEGKWRRLLVLREASIW